MIVTRFAPLKIRRRSHWYHVAFLLQAFVLVMGSSFVLAPAAAQTHFSTCADGTGNIFNATIIVPETSTPTINGVALAPGSEMAVYSESTPGFCAGTVTWDHENVAITVWGDDTNTEDVLEGLVEGERMLFRVWDASTRTEYRDDAVTVTFESEPGFATNNRYYNDAIYVVADLRVTASSPPPPPSSGSAIGEAGTVSVKQTTGDQWHSVTLKQSYTNPVVILGPPSYNGSQPLTTRVRNVSSTGFEFQFDEWDYLDGEHIEETVSYFVVEAGTHQLPDGSTLEAGTLPGINHTWTNAAFATQFDGQPVVLVQAQSYAGGSAVTTRLDKVSTDGFSVRLQEEENNDGSHAGELVGYIAVKPTTISSGHKLEVGRTAVSDTWSAFAFKQSYGESVAVLASLHTYNGSDPVALRHTKLVGSGLEFLLEEEQSKDAELQHVSESAGYLAIQSGVLEALPPPSSSEVIGEAGRVSVTHDHADHWHTVTLKHSYKNPVVVLGPPSYNGSHPLTTRVRNVSSTGFEFQFDEWDYLDGNHTEETASYLVVEAGTHQLSDGSTLEAGLLESNHNWKNVSFTSSFKTKPVVLTQTSSDNGGQAVTTRMKDVTSSGFSVRLQEEDGGDGQHTMEAVGYIAVTPTTIASGHKLEAGHTGDSVTHAWHAMSFKQSYGSSVAFLAAMQTYDGGDAATVRYTDLTESKASVMVEEETSRDDEIDHTTEVVGYLAIQSGTFEGTSAAAHASLKVSAEEVSDLQTAEELPGAYVLEGNYPNPFNPETTIGYALPEAGNVQLTVFDALGRRVAVLVDARQAAGRHETRFDARDLPSGVYFYRLEAGSFVQMKKMLLVK